MRIGGLGIYIGSRRGSGWSPTGDTTLLAKVLFWGAVSEISGGQMPNKIDGATDFITVAGSPATYQAPDAAAYKSADTDKIWFKYTANLLRTASTAELIGYDFARTMIKYDNTSPYTIREIIILKSGEVLTATEENNLRDYMQLSVWWSNVLSLHGAWKGNRGVGQSVWTAEGSTLMTSLLNYFPFTEASGNLIDVVSANNGTPTGATPGAESNTAWSFDGNDKIVLAADHTFLTTQSFTIAMWVKPIAINTSEIFLQMNANVSGRAELYKVNADAVFKIVGSNGLGTTLVTYTNILTTAWCHVAGVRNIVTDTINIYVNGVPWGTPVADATTANVGPFRIILGQTYAAAAPYTGLMKKLGIWTKALSTTEIQELMVSTYPF